MPCTTHLKATYKPYVALYFTKWAFLKYYLGIIHPLPDKSKWPYIEADEILPPNVHRLPSRPKTCRRKEPDEKPTHSKKFTVSCIYHRGIKQNRRCCPGNSTNASKNTRTMMVNHIV